MSDVIMVTADQMADSLKQRFGELTDKVEEYRQSADRAPAIVQTHEQAELMTKFIKQLGLVSRQIEDRRKVEVDPYRASTKAINDWFSPYKDTLDGLKKEMTSRLDLFQREQARIAREKAEAERREAEARALKQAEAARTAEEVEQAAKALEQADKAPSRAPTGATITDAGTATVRTFWTFEGLDMATIDLEALRPYLDPSAIEKAIRAAIKDGQRDLKGVNIVQQSTTVVR